MAIQRFHASTGATNSSLSLTNVTLANAGDYVVIVTNSARFFDQLGCDADHLGYRLP